MCTSFQIIAVIAVIIWSLVGFVIVLFMLVGCCALFTGTGNFSYRDAVNSNRVFGYAHSYVSDYLPISSTPPKDGICAICTDEAREGDQWKTLTCDHKFHPGCIDPWLSQHPTCPLCRKVQTPNERSAFAV